MSEQWKVSETQATQYGASPNYGYGFSIMDWRGAPLLTLTYQHEHEAKAAEEAIKLAVAMVADIFKH